MQHRSPFAVCAPVIVLLAALACGAAPAQTGAASPAGAIDRDLLDVTVTDLHRLYDGKKYTVTQVVQWHLERIDRYNGVYGAIETVFGKEALAEAARQDAEMARGGARGPLRGVPVVI